MANKTVQPVEDNTSFILGVPKQALTLPATHAKMLVESGVYEYGGSATDESKAAGETALETLGAMSADQQHREENDGTSAAALQNAIDPTVGESPASAGVTPEEAVTESVDEDTAEPTGSEGQE